MWFFLSVPAVVWVAKKAEEVAAHVAFLKLVEKWSQDPFCLFNRVASDDDD